MNSNFATANLIKLGSNNELNVEENRPFTPPEFVDNFESNRNVETARKKS